MSSHAIPFHSIPRTYVIHCGQSSTSPARRTRGNQKHRPSPSAKKPPPPSPPYYQLTVTGASTLWTLLSSTRISLALRQRALTSPSLRYSHLRSRSICSSRLELHTAAPCPPPPAPPPPDDDDEAGSGPRTAGVPTVAEAEAGRAGAATAAEAMGGGGRGAVGGAVAAGLGGRRVGVGGWRGGRLSGRSAVNVPWANLWTLLDSAGGNRPTARTRGQREGREGGGRGAGFFFAPSAQSCLVK